MQDGQRMRAALLVRPAEIVVRDVEFPYPAPGELVVRVGAALTCGTDRKAYLRGHPKMTMPSLFGHEFAGEVAGVGREVKAFHEGDQVMATNSAPCGECYHCRRQQENLCPLVLTTLWCGAFAEYVRLPAHIVRRNTYPKPPQLTYQVAALLEPLACVLHGLGQVSVRPDDTVAILGAGAIGLMHLLILRARGVERILVVGRRPNRLETAAALGATAVWNVAQGPVREWVWEHTAGRGADIVIECTGEPAVWEAAFGLARRGGEVVLFGGCPAGSVIRVDPVRVHYDELTIRSPFHSTPAAVRQAYACLAEDRLNWNLLISADYPLSEVAQAFECLHNGDCIKYAIIP